MDAPPVRAEPARESRAGRWIREVRLRIALLIGLVETLLILLGDLRWFVVVGTAAAVVAFYFLVGRRVPYHAVRELSWTLALSQLIAVVIPLLFEVVRILAIALIVLIALLLVAMLLLERR